MSHSHRSLNLVILILLASAAPLRAASPATYTPQFTAVKTELGHYWIEDHGRRMALFGCSTQGTAGYQIGLFRQSPAQEIDEKALKDGTGFLGMPGLRLDTNWISAPAMQGVPGEMKLDDSDPKQLTIRLSWKKSAEEFGTQVLRVAYDQDLTRYVVHVEDNLQLSKPDGGEFCNFYPNGVGDFRPWMGRYDRLLYQDADDGGKLKTHYLNVQIPKPTPGPINLPPNGLIGYVEEKEGNPVVIVEESTPPTMVNICLCWFDAHLRWDMPAKWKNIPRPVVPGPPYRYHARLKAYWNTSDETIALLTKAETVSLAPFADRFEMVLPVDMNVVNDFEHTAYFLYGDVKHIYLPLKPLRKTGGVSYDTTVGRSAHNSVRFVSTTDKGMETSLTGPELMVTPGRQVKISAWAKTADVSGEGFYLESGFLGGGEQIGPKYRSAKLTSNNDWTLLEIPLPVTPARAAFLGKGRITFRLSGKGTAWVDDFVFSEQDAAENGVPTR